MSRFVSTTDQHDAETSLFAGKPGYRWARRLPRPSKRFLLACYWPLKALVEDWQDYTSELVGYIPCHRFRLMWLRGACRVRIGAHSSVHRRCRMYHPHRIVIGSNTVVNYGVLLDGRGGLHIGDNVSISEGCLILSMQHDIDDPEFCLQGGFVTIEDHVFIGSRATILPGVTVGEGAVVAAGAVASRDVAPYTVVAGVPARRVRERNRDLRYRLDHRKRFG
jgi:acetyltransferase-like isoleucine patch superfamily enzyme